MTTFTRILALTAVVPALLALPAPAQAAVTCQGVRATIVGTPHDDVLRGTPDRDVIAGLGGDDVLRGLGGSDLLCGGAGDDQLYGGADRRWHDQFQTIATGDRLDGGGGDDRLDPGPKITGVDLVQPDLLVFASADGVIVDLGARTATGQGHDTIVWRKTLGVVGSPGDDHLIGTDGPDHLVGRGGSDLLEGHGGGDVLVADSGGDSVRGGPGADEITSTGGGDGIRGGGGDDVISVRGHVWDAVSAGRGSDLVFVDIRTLRSLRLSVFSGGPHNAGPEDNDTIYLSSQAALAGSTFIIDMAAETLRANRYRGSLGDFDSLNFSVPGARLTFRGSDGPDELTIEGNSRVNANGRGGDDVLYGGPRNDRLIGGDGNDFVSGSGGTDTCDAERMRGCES